MPYEKHHISAGNQTTSQCYCDSCRETPLEAEEVCCNISMCDRVRYFWSTVLQVEVLQVAAKVQHVLQPPFRIQHRKLLRKLPTGNCVCVCLCVFVCACVRHWVVFTIVDLFSLVRCGLSAILILPLRADILVSNSHHLIIFIFFSFYSSSSWLFCVSPHGTN